MPCGLRPRVGAAGAAILGTDEEVLMTRVGTEIHVDPAVLAGVDQLARVEGRSRDEVIEDAVRRTVAARTLRDVVDRSRVRSDLSSATADTLVAEERRAARAARRTPADGR